MSFKDILEICLYISIRLDKRHCAMAWIYSWVIGNCTRYLQEACSEMIKVIAFTSGMSCKKSFPITSDVL